VNDERRDDRPPPNDVITPEAPLDHPRPGVQGEVPLGPGGARPATSTEAGGAHVREDEGARVGEVDEEPDVPVLRPAVLGRLEGLGLITVVHDASGALVDADGSWRPADETATLDELRETFPEGSVTTFAGTAVAGRAAVASRRHSGAGDVSMQVVIKRHGEYEDHDGRVLRVVNFVPRELS
jgi:hypothetical protein